MFNNLVWLQPSWGLTVDIEMKVLSGMYFLFNVSLFTVSLQICVGSRVIDIYLWLDQDQLVVGSKRDWAQSERTSVFVKEGKYFHLCRCKPTSVHSLLAEVEEYSNWLLPVQLGYTLPWHL